MSDTIPQKYCPKCEQFKDATTKFFHLDKSHPDGFQTYCKGCRVVKTEFPKKGGRPRKAEEITEKNPVGRPRKGDYSCTQCGENDPAKFYVNSKGERRSRCRACDYKRNLQKYGLSDQTYQEMLVSQFGLCALCGKAPKSGKFCVDHCHSSGVVRGLLCYPCNNLLGCAQDNPEVLRKAVKYLRLHSI